MGNMSEDSESGSEAGGGSSDESGKDWSDLEREAAEADREGDLGDQFVGSSRSGKKGPSVPDKRSSHHSSSKRSSSSHHRKSPGKSPGKSSSHSKHRSSSRHSSSPSKHSSGHKRSRESSGDRHKSLPRKQGNENLFREINKRKLQ